MKAWEGIAAAEYAVDGSMDGWDDDKKQSQSSEDKYLLVIQLLTAFSCCLFLEPNNSTSFKQDGHDLVPLTRMVDIMRGQ